MLRSGLDDQDPVALRVHEVISFCVTGTGSGWW